MARYVVLYKLTQQGIQNIKDSPNRAREAIAKFEAAGGKVLAFFSTMGPYDLIAITEAPSEEMAAAFLLGQGAQGNVTTLTMKAFDIDEYASIVGMIP
jgi:uncharacterized protein with GYD domain